MGALEEFNRRPSDIRYILDNDYTKEEIAEKVCNERAYLIDLVTSYAENQLKYLETL